MRRRRVQRRLCRRRDSHVFAIPSRPAQAQASRCIFTGRAHTWSVATARFVAHGRCHMPPSLSIVPTMLLCPQIADVLTEHESCSKQHAVLQFRRVTVAPKKKTLDATVKRVVKCVACRCRRALGAGGQRHLVSRVCVLARARPYLLDLQSANGTFVNGKRLEDSR